VAFADAGATRTGTRAALFSEGGTSPKCEALDDLEPIRSIAKPTHLRPPLRPSLGAVRWTRTTRPRHGRPGDGKSETISCPSDDFILSLFSPAGERIHVRPTYPIGRLWSAWRARFGVALCRAEFAMQTCDEIDLSPLTVFAAERAASAGAARSGAALPDPAESPTLDRRPENPLQGIENVESAPELRRAPKSAAPGPDALSGSSPGSFDASGRGRQNSPRRRGQRRPPGNPAARR
jgi:hypothetical protein